MLTGVVEIVSIFSMLALVVVCFIAWVVASGLLIGRVEDVPFDRSFLNTVGLGVVFEFASLACLTIGWLWPALWLLIIEPPSWRWPLGWLVAGTVLFVFDVVATRRRTVMLRQR
jgi:hypothetical protein